jgi:capsid assembly protease
MKYPNIVRAVLETPWAILPEKLAEVRELVSLRADGVVLTAEEIEVRIGDGPAQRDMQMVGSVAVVPLYGVIVPKVDLMTQMSGGTPIDRFRATLAAAVRDPDVSAVVIDVDSPGGQTDLLTEAASDIRAMRGSKPIVAVANTVAASAAYWLATQADELVVTPSGSVGSVGVFAAHEDVSAQQEMDGVKTTLVSAGKYKTELTPFAPLSEEARAYVQQRVDDAYSQFTADVAKGRRVSVESVRVGFGEGRMVSAKQAVKLGMADGVESIQSVIGRLSAAPAKTRRGQSVAAHWYGRDVAAAVLAASRPIREVEPAEPDENGDQWKQYEHAGTSILDVVEAAGPIAPHKTATTDTPWDNAENKRRLRNDGDEAYYRRAYAWQDDDADPNTKVAYKFIHHEVNADGEIGAANLTACSQGIGVLNGGRTGTTIPDADRKGVWNHLAKHLSDAGREPPPLHSLDLDQAAMSGLSFAARLRGTLRVLEDHVATARDFADVQAGHLTDTKREQFVAVDEALRALVAVQADIRQLLDETDPQKPVEEARSAALAYMARRVRERGAV